MKDDRLIMELMIEYCDAIISDVSAIGGDIDDFLESPTTQRACSFSLLQIGEHVKRISDETRNRYDHIDWKKIAGMRDFIAHRYDQADILEIWNTIKVNIPDLREKLSIIISETDSEERSASDVKSL